MAAVSQFTLLANTRKGNKPDFHGAMSSEQAKELYDMFFKRVQSLYDAEKVKNGVFQAMMEVGLVNDGPVGVDYRSEDGAVNLKCCFSSEMVAAADYGSWIRLLWRSRPTPPRLKRLPNLRRVKIRRRPRRRLSCQQSCYNEWRW